MQLQATLQVRCFIEMYNIVLCQLIQHGYHVRQKLFSLLTAGKGTKLTNRVTGCLVEVFVTKPLGIV